MVVNYNQIHEIENVLSDVLQYKSKYDIIVVDDGSIDGSDEIARKMGFQLIAHETNKGVGAAIRSGIDFGRKNGFDYIIIMASNGKMKAKDIPVISEKLISGEADYVQGSRFLNKDSSIELTPFRKFAIPVFTSVFKTLLGIKSSDLTCGYRAYLLSILDNEKININQNWLDRYELEYYIHYWVHKLHYRVVEVPVTMDYSHLHKGRKSKIVPILDWWSMSRPFILLSLGLKK